MKKIIDIFLGTLLVGCLCLVVTSCKDDDSDSGSNGSEDVADESRTAAERFWDVAANLVSPLDVTDDYQDKTFEPTIGTAADGSSTIRVVSTGGLSAAAARFADLTGAEVDENTSTYTYHDDAVGTLTYKKSTDGKSLATVDVNIKQIPHLQQIVYKTADQMGENGKFAGTPYYSFGDVVLVYNADGNEEYWVCVRPALGMAGKSDTHWVTVAPLPKANIFNYHGKKKDIEFNMPKYLKNGTEHSQNLAEMLYAMFNSQTWQSNTEQYSKYGVTGPKGLPIFHDLKPERVQYFNKFFWKRVLDTWTKSELFDMVFGYSADEMREIVNSDNGLHLVYDSKWSTSVSNSPTIYEYVYKNGTGNKSNMHDFKKTSVSKNVMSGDGIKVDCVSQYKKKHWVNREFFGDDTPRFIVRCATGAELLGSNPTVYTTIASQQRRISDTYQFNKEYNIAVGPQTAPVVWTDTGIQVELDLESDFKGDPYYRLGDVYRDENGHKWFVVSEAGSYLEGIDKGDKGFYGELVSFDGLTPSADNRTITNLPTRDQALRAINYLWGLFIHTSDFKKERNEMEDDEMALLGGCAFNILENCNCDVRMLFQQVRPVDKTYWARESHHLASIAYKDSADNSGKQRLMRFIKNSTNKGHEMEFYIWDNYVLDPDTATEIHAPERFSNVPIYLQDIAEQATVNNYAKDTYARQPLGAKDAWVPNQNYPYRNWRSNADTKARNVTNYYYNVNSWHNRTFPTDMWNSPVLMFRVTAVYDRGTRHLTKTVDGHTLTLVSKRQWDKRVLTELDVILNAFNFNLEDYYIDGKKIGVPSRKSVWNKLQQQQQ